MGVATELASQIFGISIGAADRALQECGGGNREEEEANDLGIRDPVPLGRTL